MAEVSAALRQEPHRRYRYAVLFIGFVTLAGASGVSGRFATFSWSRASGASLYSVNMLVFIVSAPLSGWLFDCYGPHVVLSIAALLSGATLLACSTLSVSSAVSLVSPGGPMFFGWLVDRVYGEGAFSTAMSCTITGFVMVLIRGQSAASWFLHAFILIYGFAQGAGGISIFATVLVSGLLALSCMWIGRQRQLTTRQA